MTSWPGLEKKKRSYLVIKHRSAMLNVCPIQHCDVSNNSCFMSCFLHAVPRYWEGNMSQRLMSKACARFASGRHVHFTMFQETMLTGDISMTSHRVHCTVVP